MNKILKLETILESISKDLSKGASVLDSILKFCENNGHDVEDVGAMIRRNETLFQKAKEDAMSQNLLKNNFKEDNLDEFFS